MDFPSDINFDFALAGTIRAPLPGGRLRGGRKRCSLGKSCQATCINKGLVCRVELGPNISSSLSRIKLKINVDSHHSLKNEYTRSRVLKAMTDMSKLDPDAPRRVEILRKVFDKTKTLFIDWKDTEGNKEAFMRAFSKIVRNPEKTFFSKIHDKTWGGLAFESGATLIRASKDFNPTVKKIKAATEKHLTAVSSGKELPHTVGKAPGSGGNNVFVTLVHELGHHAHFASGTMELPTTIKNVSTYSKTNQKELYAELFSAYMFAGPRMKKLFPTEYNLVESVLSKSNLL